MKDHIIRALSKNGEIRAFVAHTTHLVNKAQKIHQTYPVATAALGRALTAGAMMGAMLKGEKDSLTIQIKGDGPLGGILVVGDSKANVKGYVHNPQVETIHKANGKLDVGTAVGKNGYLNIVRDFGLKEPYIGQVSLVSGEIAEDLTYYYAKSEQIPSVVALGVLVDVDYSVKVAGGFILQLMPEASERTIDKLESVVKELKPVTQLISEGMTPEDILTNVFGDFEWEMGEKMDTQFACDCSRKRITNVLIALGREELENIIREDGKAELTCHFCNNKYNFDKKELEKLLANTQY